MGAVSGARNLVRPVVVEEELAILEVFRLCHLNNRAGRLILPCKTPSLQVTERLTVIMFALVRKRERECATHIHPEFRFLLRLLGSEEQLLNHIRLEWTGDRVAKLSIYDHIMSFNV